MTCEPPAASGLDQRRVETADFKDAYRAPLTQPDQGMVEVFAAVFGHSPLVVKLVLIARNAVARFCGLEVPTVAQIMRPVIRGPYSVGDRIGPWPIFAINDSEIIAGRDNRHMDFRLSVLKQGEEGAASITVSTICNAHNLAGTLYLFCIVPFHRVGVQRLIANAVVAKRL